MYSVNIDISWNFTLKIKGKYNFLCLSDQTFLVNESLFNIIVIANSKKISDYQTNKLETKSLTCSSNTGKNSAVYKAWPNWNNPRRESVGYKGRRKIV